MHAKLFYEIGFYSIFNIFVLLSTLFCVIIYALTGYELIINKNIAVSKSVRQRVFGAGNKLCAAEWIALESETIGLEKC